jgi:hypothetical protein
MAINVVYHNVQCGVLSPLDQDVVLPHGESNERLRLNIEQLYT